ncbi:hypothetical protein HYFRA_00011185 [Hymenoscyphus fraxineus]|uniref:Transcription factor CBF/NF-Y/archaeal histone domain-containing protein n=1 Tax=Hymenoscyphus fraxineus TaxID=746836 RepID=A0A9N9PRD7_9HELO|nr:hypothetical protein HYFRA_00011185 [Hymenoscyphus fraxineus]
MSADSGSPPKEDAVASPDNDQMNDPSDPHASGLGYEFEVKEQDRWLPIANALFSALVKLLSGIASPPYLTFTLHAHVIHLVGQSLNTRRKRWRSCCVTAVTPPPIMSHESSSPSQSPSSPRGPRGGSGKHGHPDANIRNFAPVARIMKTALPDNAKIAKEAKECMQECVSEFISFITSEASEKCHQEKRKTVNGEDILFAMTSLGFENYAEALKIYLSKYRETQSTRGENRPGSQGYGAAGASGGAANATSSTTFTGGAEGNNNILGGQQQPEAGEHDAGAFHGSLYGGQVPSGHNGATGGDGY